VHNGQTTQPSQRTNNINVTTDKQTSQTIVKSSHNVTADMRTAQANVTGKCHSGYSNVTAVRQTSSIKANTEISSQAKNHNVPHHRQATPRTGTHPHRQASQQSSSNANVPGNVTCKRHRQMSQANVIGKCHRQMSQARLAGQSSQADVRSSHHRQ
jgi:hypothetical protein